MLSALLISASPVSAFHPVELDVPVLLNPADGASFTLGDILNSRVMLDWSDVPRSVSYEVSIIGPLGFYNIFPYTTSSELLFNCTSIEGRYDWRVRAWSVERLVSEYSDSRSFSVTGSVRPTPSDTPTPTQTPTVTPTPVNPADRNTDGVIDARDLFDLSTVWFQLSGDGDLSGDDRYDGEDLILFVGQWHR